MKEEAVYAQYTVYGLVNAMHIAMGIVLLVKNQLIYKKTCNFVLSNAQLHISMEGVILYFIVHAAT